MYVESTDLKWNPSIQIPGPAHLHYRKRLRSNKVCNRYYIPYCNFSFFLFCTNWQLMDLIGSSLLTSDQWQCSATEFYCSRIPQYQQYHYDYQRRITSFKSGCLDNSKICNGVADCDSGIDELNCKIVSWTQYIGLTINNIRKLSYRVSTILKISSFTYLMM